MIRKKLFEIATTVYKGEPILPGLDRKINMKHINRTEYQNNKDKIKLFNTLDTANLYLLLSRPLGMGTFEVGQSKIMQVNWEFKHHDQNYNEDPYLFYFANKGLYEDIP